jgi:hypothetical protein
MDYKKLKDQVIVLRKQGKTYSEINNYLDKPLSKSTISYWCKGIILSEKQSKRISKIREEKIKNGQKIAVKINQIKRQKYLESIENRVKHLKKVINNKDVAKIAVAMLFLGEGSKSKTRGSLVFGNSDPDVIHLFLNLLRFCYKIDKIKFRCTLQCRADQNIKELEKFWSKTTDIPLAQFYKAQVDPRTIGKPSKKLEYKGVCRIDYFSADIFIELTKIGELLKK